MPAEPDKRLTKNGFTRSKYLTKAQLKQIMKGIAAGGREGVVCREHGTSFTQFLRRVRSDPALFAEYRVADRDKHRARALESQRERDQASGTKSDDG